MKLEEQVVSFELAKRLKELGVKQESYFSWEVVDIYNIAYPRLVSSHIETERSGNNLIAAFTVAELGGMLPDFVPDEEDPDFYGALFFGINLHGGRRNYTSSYTGRDEVFVDTNEANSRAQMLIWLIEKGHVKFD